MNHNGLFDRSIFIVLFKYRQLPIIISFFFSFNKIIMEDQPTSDNLFDTADLVLLSAIGLGTAAWFGRHQIANLLFGKKQTPSPVSSTVPKRERNFVKVMEEQV